MDIEICPNPFVSGTIRIPPSKSYSQRALALAFLVDHIQIYGLGHSKDEETAFEILKSCGLVSETNNDVTTIQNNFDFHTDISIHCGESGLSARLFSCLFALNTSETIVHGEGTLLARDMSPLAAFYQQIDARYHFDHHRLPLTIKGSRKSTSIDINGSESSQYITGILYYLVGLQSDKPLSLNISQPTSIPYIHMTIEYLNLVGGDVTWTDENTIVVHPSRLKSTVDIRVEGDWSSAAFWMVAAAIGGRIHIENLNEHSLQADRAILDVMMTIGANVTIVADSITVEKNELKAFQLDASNCPDLIPVLSVLALFCDGTCRIKGTQRLSNKESNRIQSILSEFNKFSASIENIDNTFIINPLQNIQAENIVFDSHEDHRIAMSLCILALNLPNKTVVRGIDCIHKSYPAFIVDFNKIQN
jgi:3-phosphoshikimate 1-carboxyvinyltransferase